MRYLTHAGIILVACIVLAILMISERGKRDVLRDQLSEADSRVHLVGDSLKVSLAETSGLTVQLSENTSERDSLKALWEESERQRGALRNTIGIMEERLTHTQDSLDRDRTALDSVKASLVAYTTEQESLMATKELQLKGLTHERDSLNAMFDGVYPWYAYYRHEAGRNWAKKLVGAGRGQRPDTLDPWQETKRAQELQANDMQAHQSHPGGSN